MKKLTIFLVCISLILSVLLTGCDAGSFIEDILATLGISQNVAPNGNPETNNEQGSSTNDEKEIELIEISAYPSTMDYLVGDSIDLTGMALRILYSDSTYDTITTGFKCEPSYLNNAGVQTVIVSYEGKTTEFSVNVSESVQGTSSDGNKNDSESDTEQSETKSITSIQIKEYPAKTEYCAGEKFNDSGMTIEVLYSDSTSEILNSGFECSPESLNAVGSQTVTVTYKGISTSFDVNVKEAQITSISIKNLPSKIDYYIGDSLDTSGLTVTASYSNGETKEISSGISCSPSNMNTEGSQKITVEYEGQETTFSVNVSKLAVSSVSVKSTPKKTEYFIGDKLETSGLAITVTYSNGSTKDISSGFTCSPSTFNTEGSQKITIEYEGKNTSFNVKVSTASVSSLSVKAKPKKTDYFIGDKLSVDGLVISASYTDGSSKDISSGFTYTPDTLNTEGSQKITVEYEGKKTTFNVTVAKVSVSSVSVKTAPTKTEYNQGDKLETKGLVITATYNDGTTKDISSGISCSPTTLNNSGAQKITVEYEGKKTSFSVNVSKLTVEDISVKNKPSKLEYYVGDELDPSGLVITASFSNGTKKDITDGISYSPSKLNTAGNQTITLKYEGHSATVSVVVHEIEITSVSIKSKPSKTEYFEGDSFDPSGMSLTVKYNNGTSKTVSSGYKYGPATLSKTGDQEITVTYEGISTKFSVSVSSVSVSSVSIKSNPTKTTYTCGDTLNTSGLKLTVKYSNGKEETVSSGFSCSPSTLSSEGKQTVTVSYGGKSAKFSVNVEEAEFSTRSAPSDFYYSLEYYRNQLNSVDKAIYDDILAMLKNMDTEYTQNSYFDTNGLFDIYNLVKLDHPELFWAPSEASLSGMTRNGIMISMTLSLEYPSYCNTPAKRDQCIKEINSRSQKMIDKAKNLSDFKAVLLLYEYIQDEVIYGINTTDRGLSVYGAAVVGTAVCEGYSEWFAYMLNQIGIPVIIVDGNAINSANENEDHEWTMAQLDGDWYFFDVTWDDPKGRTRKEPYHDYFGLTTSDLSTHHTARSLPKATATKDNYYYKYDLVIESESELEEKIKNSFDRFGFVDIRFKSKSMFDKYNSDYDWFWDINKSAGLGYRSVAISYYEPTHCMTIISR